MNIASKAEKLVLGDRNESYGDPRQDFERIARVWSGLLHSKLKAEITPEEAILMMVGLKLCREVHKPKEDTRIDVIGYMLCLDWVTTGQQPQVATTQDQPLTDKNLDPQVGCHPSSSPPANLVHEVLQKQEFTCRGTDMKSFYEVEK